MLFTRTPRVTRLSEKSKSRYRRPRHDTAKETKASRPKSKSTQIDGGWKDTQCLDSQLLRVCCLLDRGWVEGARGMIRAPERRDIVKHRRYAVAGASRIKARPRNLSPPIENIEKTNHKQDAIKQDTDKVMLKYVFMSICLYPKFWGQSIPNIYVEVEYEQTSVKGAETPKGYKSHI